MTVILGESVTTLEGLRLTPPITGLSTSDCGFFCYTVNMSNIITSPVYNKTICRICDSEVPMKRTICIACKAEFLRHIVNYQKLSGENMEKIADYILYAKI